MVIHPKYFLDTSTDFYVVFSVCRFKIHRLVDEVLKGQFERFVFAASYKPWKSKREPLVLLSQVCVSQCVYLAHSKAISLDLPNASRFEPNIWFELRGNLVNLACVLIDNSFVCICVFKRHVRGVQSFQLFLCEASSKFTDSVKALKFIAVGCHQIRSEYPSARPFSVESSDRDKV